MLAYAIITTDYTRIQDLLMTSSVVVAKIAKLYRGYCTNNKTKTVTRLASYRSYIENRIATYSSYIDEMSSYLPRMHKCFLATTHWLRIEKCVDNLY